MSWVDGIIKQVRDYDATRPRSVQAAVGWSEVGGCRAALGFRLDGAWATDETDTWAAQRGIDARKLELNKALGVHLISPATSSELHTDVARKLRDIRKAAA